MFKTETVGPCLVWKLRCGGRGREGGAWPLWPPSGYASGLYLCIIPLGLKIKKKPAFHPVSEDFEVTWNSILYNAERSIVELLLYESEKVIAKIQVEIQEEFNEKNPEKFERKYA